MPAANAADVTPPSQPQDMIAVKCTATSITLQWSPSRDDDGVAGYRVIQDGIALSTIAGTSTSIAGLTSGVSYQFSVQACDSAGNWSVPSEVKSYHPAGAWTSAYAGSIYSYNVYDYTGNYLYTYSSADGYMLRTAQPGTWSITIAGFSGTAASVSISDSWGYNSSFTGVSVGDGSGNIVFNLHTTDVPGASSISIMGVNQWCTGSYLLTVQFQPDTQSPVACFDTTQLSATTPATAQFDASGSLAPAGNSIASYAWDFENDGVTDGGGVTSSHAYSPPSSFNGYFLSRLTVLGGNGVAAPTSRKVLDVTPPTIPANLRVTGYGSEYGYSNFTIAWDPSSDNIKMGAYEIYANGSMVWYWCDSTSLTLSSWAATTPCTITIRAKDWGANCSGFSQPLYVTAPSPPIFTSHPQRGVVVEGEPITLSVVATGSPAPTYQWRKDGVDISGATAASYSIAAVQATHEGSYTVAASNASGSSVSNAGSLRLLPSGTSATHAAPGAGYTAGQTLTITNTITYTGDVAGLGWHVELPVGWSYVGGSNEGATKPVVGATAKLDWSWTSVPLASVTFSYDVAVPAGTTGDQALPGFAIVRRTDFDVAFQIVANPDPLIISPNSASVANSRPVQLMANFVVTNGRDPFYHSADANKDHHIDLTELLRVIELYNTRNGTVRTGCYTTNDWSEDGFEAAPGRPVNAVVTLFRYYSGDTDRNGKLNLSELLRMIELYNYRRGYVRTGEYHEESGTEDNFATGPGSNRAPSVFQQPQDVFAALGSTVSFNVYALGTPPFYYQWRKDGVAIPSATGETFTLSNVQAADAGSYSVLVINSIGGVPSSVATLTVNSVVPGAPVASAATAVTSTGFAANWSAVAGATGYWLDVSISSSFGSFVSGYQDRDAGNVTGLAVTGLSATTTYYYRIRAVNASGASGNSNTISATTLASAANGDDDSDGILNGVEQQLGTQGHTTTPDTSNSTQLNVHKP